MSERDRFNLNQIREGLRSRAAELSEDANPRTVDHDAVETGPMKPFTFQGSDYDRTEAPKDAMQKYWRQFETTPIIRKPITSFASRVVEPGYYIESESLDEDEMQKLGRWLETSSILEGQPGQDFRLLAKKAIIQREVRGTVLVEKAPHKDDEQQIAGFKMLHPETIEAVTRPHQNILLAREDAERFEGAPKAESGGAAAWLQDVSEANELSWGTPIRDDADDDMKVGFARDEIIPLTRDADIGEVFGTSRIESVSDRIEGIKQKLSDNDEAISSKAYPLWLFKFGSEDNPWDGNDIDKFMKAHEVKNFHPGMKQGVRGDVSIDTISGEVAEIAEYLNFDLQWIMASMPMPMFTLGAFGELGAGGGRVAGVAQQQDISRQIKEARTELEDEFTPVLQEVAQQQGVDEEAAKDIRLRIGNPERPDPDVTPSQQLIRYVSDADRDKTQRPADEPQKERQQTSTPPASVPSRRPTDVGGDGQAGSDSDDSSVPVIEEQIDGKYGAVWGERSAEELSFGNRDIQSVSDSILKVFTRVRDRTLEQVGQRYESTPQFAAVEFENIANRELNRAVREVGVRDGSKDAIEQQVSSVKQEYGDSGRLFTQSQNVSFFAQNIENATRDAAEEMLRRARIIVRDGVSSGEKWDAIQRRLLQKFTESYLNERANLIAHMELKNAIETTKLQTFESNPDIIGVRVSNPDASTPITRSLHGATAYFDDDVGVDEQLRQQADEHALLDGFDPLPKTPPYHFNDTTTLEPIYRDGAE